MKTIWLPALLLCSGCAAINPPPWGWLDDPERQQWVDVHVSGYGREISYSIPDRSNGWRERPRIWPPLEENEPLQRVDVPTEAYGERSRPLGQYIWEEWWGGPFKGSGHDFTLNVRVGRYAELKGLLDLTLRERLQRPVDYRKELYSGPEWELQKLGEYFFERFWVKPFMSKTGLPWIAQNDPIVLGDHVYYTIPITNQHILEFSFFVRDKRFGWKEDPEWNASRWALVEQIMNTVRITPPPFAEDSETRPAVTVHEKNSGIRR